MTDERRPHLLQLAIETPDGRLDGSLMVPPIDIRLSELAFNALPLCSKLVDMAEKRVIASGQEISCRKGCGACCRQVVPVSLPEAWMIADLVASFPPERQEEVRSRFAAASERIDAAGLRDRFVSALDADTPVLHEYAAAYFGLGVACPFLEDESCSIHRERPSVCREFLVTSPREHCSRPSLLPVVRVEIRRHFALALARLTGTLLGEPPKIMPLTLALEWAESRRTDAERRWEARMLLEELVAELGRAHAG